MQDISLWLPIAFFLIALSYSMVGFGGGSSYLAVLVLAGFPYQNIPPLALACNVIVATCGFWNFYKAGHFDLKKGLPFVILSIPLAYCGGKILIGKELFSLLLGLALLAVAIRMSIPEHKREESNEVGWKIAWALGLPAGAALGFLSGLLGIGGGIFLSPLLILTRWASVKKAGACASFFILVNSLAGLAGHLSKGEGDFSLLLPLGLTVLLGGLVGSRVGAYRIPSIKLGQVMAVLILCASVKLILEAL